MSKLFEEMAQGTAEARAYMEGERKGYKVTLPESVDVRGIRNRLHFSQGRFADAFGLSVDAVRHWESGRRSPEAAARALLTVIAHDPQFVMRALAHPQQDKLLLRAQGKSRRVAVEQSWHLPADH